MFYPHVEILHILYPDSWLLYILNSIWVTHTQNAGRNLLLKKGRKSKKFGDFNKMNNS